MSMSPTFKEGEIIFYKKYINNKSNLKVDQIVIFKHPLEDMIEIKRIKQIKKNCIEVIGDNLQYSIDSRTSGFVQ